jgi:uncharacterized protein
MRLAWNGTPDWRAEVCEAVLSEDGIVATGAQLGAAPEPYRASYELEVRSGWITRRLRVEVAGVGSVELIHDGKGTWAGVPNAAELEGALDCDIAFSPLTNTMPIRRHGLHEEAGAADVAVAWVALPDMTVHLSRQRYEHLEPGRVRFTSGDFLADLEIDGEGLVVAYPGLARRVE